MSVDEVLVPAVGAAALGAAAAVKLLVRIVAAPASDFYGMFHRLAECIGYTREAHLPEKNRDPLVPKKLDAMDATFAARIALSKRIIRSLLKYGPSALRRLC